MYALSVNTISGHAQHGTTVISIVQSFRYLAGCAAARRVCGYAGAVIGEQLHPCTCLLRSRLVMPLDS